MRAFTTNFPSAAFNPDKPSTRQPAGPLAPPTRTPANLNPPNPPDTTVHPSNRQNAPHPPRPELRHRRLGAEQPGPTVKTGRTAAASQVAGRPHNRAIHPDIGTRPTELLMLTPTARPSGLTPAPPQPRHPAAPAPPQPFTRPTSTPERPAT